MTSLSLTEHTALVSVAGLLDFASGRNPTSTDAGPDATAVAPGASITGESLASVDSSLVDLSRDGPFDA